MGHRPFHAKTRFLAFLLLAWAGVTVAVAGATPGIAPPLPDWVVECAACPHNFYDLGPRSLQVDAGGFAHVVYGGEALYHAWQSNEGWQVELIEDRLQVGSQAALVIAGDGTLHVFYLDETAQSLRYAYGTTGAWHLEIVASAIGDEPWPSPALAPDGKVHVAFHEGAQDKLVHASRDTTGWQFSTVDVGGEHPSLALNAAGRPQVSYVLDHVADTTSELRYAVYDGSWQVEVVHPAVATFESALALDSTGKVHLAYAAGATGPDGYSGVSLMYAYRDTSGWHHEVADATNPRPYDFPDAIGRHVSLALDSAGQPHVAYTSSYVGANPYPWRFYSLPRHAMRTADSWSVTLLSEYGHTEGTALTLDGSGQPHVVYQQVGDLVHSFNTGSWEHELVTLGGVAGVGASMALEAKGTAQIGSISNPIDSHFDRLLFTRRTVEGWQSEAVGYSTLDSTQLAAAPDGTPHILYNTYQRFTEDFTLGYAYRVDNGWNSNLVGAPRAAGVFYDIAVAGDGQVHAVWVAGNWPGGSLYYTPLPAPEAREWELISDAEVRHVSLATDAAQNPHVAYSAAGSLLYAYRDEAGWHEEVVASSRYGADEVALALDGNGRPHVGFYSAFSRRLLYAYRDDTGWHLQGVDWNGDVGQYLSIAVTSDGRPHISYYDATNQDLKYAYREYNMWFSETLASEGNVGLYTSIALYVYPHISYYDATHGDLHYVYRPFSPVAFSYLPILAWP